MSSRAKAGAREVSTSGPGGATIEGMGVTSAFLLREPVRLAPATRHEVRRRRRALARQDLVSARLAELVRIRDVLRDAAELVERGWLQGAWFSYSGTGGEVRMSHVADRRRVGAAPVFSRCLVAAIRDAADPAPRSDGQVSRRAAEVTWHALQGGWGGPVQWCPAPDVHLAHVRDLTRWNDRAGRTTGEVGSLLEGAIEATEAERRRRAAG